MEACKKCSAIAKWCNGFYKKSDSNIEDILAAIVFSVKIWLDCISVRATTTFLATLAREEAALEDLKQNPQISNSIELLSAQCLVTVARDAATAAVATLAIDASDASQAQELMLAVAAALAASDCVEVHKRFGSKPPNLVGDPEQLPCEHVLLWNSSSLQDLLSRLQADREFDCSRPSGVLSHSAMEHVVQPLLHTFQDGSCVLDVGSGMNLSGLLAMHESLAGTAQNTPVANFDFIGVDSARCWTDVVVVVSGTHSRATCIPVTMGTFRDEHHASASLLSTLKPTAATAASSAADGPGSKPTRTPAFVQCDEKKLEIRLVRVQPPSLGRFSQPGSAAAAPPTPVPPAPVPPAPAAASLPEPETPAEASSHPPEAPLPTTQRPQSQSQS